MTAADLGAIATFPFVEAPDPSQINDGLRLLSELGALSSGLGERPQLTGIGRRLAQIPVDPRMGRMLLAGERLGCLAEIMIIVAGMSIQDPRERPAEERDKAEALHRRFWAPMPVSSRPPSRARTALDELEGDAAEASARAGRQRLPGVPAALGLPAQPAEVPVRQRLPADVPAGVPALPADPGVAGPARPAARHRPRPEAAAQLGGRPDRAGAHRHPHRPAVPGRTGRHQGGAGQGSGGPAAGPPRGSTSARAARGSRSTPARRWPGPSRRW